MTRAEPGAGRTAQRLIALGLTPLIAPLLTIRDTTEPVPDLHDVSGLVFTSRNGIEAFQRAVEADRRLPVFAVGDATAEAARVAGFQTVYSAGGGLDELVHLIRAHLIRAERPGPDPVLLHPVAREAAADLGAALKGEADLRAWPLYEAVETGLERVVACEAALVHSPRAARALASILTRLSSADPSPRPPNIVAISPAAAQPLRNLVDAIQVSPAPNEDALLQTLTAALGKPGPRV